MRKEQRLKIDCERMKKRLTWVGINARALYDRGLCSSDEFLDMKLEERTLRQELAHIDHQLTACR